VDPQRLADDGDAVRGLEGEASLQGHVAAAQVGDLRDLGRHRRLRDVEAILDDLLARTGAGAEQPDEHHPRAAHEHL